MKLLLIADLHGTKNYDKLKNVLQNENYDCICLLGDNTGYDIDVVENYKKNCSVFGILGNHDVKKFYEINYNFINHIHNKKMTSKTYSFGGVDGSLRYNDNYNYSMYENAEFDEFLKKLDKVDILLTHASGTYFKNKIETIHHFIPSFTEYIIKNNPKYHIFGHYHTNYKTTFNNTICICVYGCVLLNTETNALKIFFEG